jgi:hypothetical protein
LKKRITVKMARIIKLWKHEPSRQCVEVNGSWLSDQSN